MKVYFGWRGRAPECPEAGEVGIWFLETSPLKLIPWNSPGGSFWIPFCPTLLMQQGGRQGPDLAVGTQGDRSSWGRDVRGGLGAGGPHPQEAGREGKPSPPGALTPSTVLHCGQRGRGCGLEAESLRCQLAEPAGFPAALGGGAQGRPLGWARKGERSQRLSWELSAMWTVFLVSCEGNPGRPLGLSPASAQVQ